MLQIDFFLQMVEKMANFWITLWFAWYQHNLAVKIIINYLLIYIFLVIIPYWNMTVIDCVILWFLFVWTVLCGFVIGHTLNVSTVAVFKTISEMYVCFHLNIIEPVQHLQLLASRLISNIKIGTLVVRW